MTCPARHRLQKNDGRDNPSCAEEEDAYDTSDDEAAPHTAQIGGGPGRRRPPQPAPVVAMTAPPPAVAPPAADSPSDDGRAVDGEEEEEEEEEAAALPVTGGPASFTVKVPVPAPAARGGRGGRRGGRGAGRGGGRAGAAAKAASTAVGFVPLSSLPRSLPSAVRQEAVKWVECQPQAPPYLSSVVPVVISLLTAYGADTFLTVPVETEEPGAQQQPLTWALLRERMLEGKYDAIGRNAFVADLRRMLGQDMQAGAPLLHTVTTRLADTDAAALEATQLGREALAPRRFFSVVRGACTAAPVARDHAAEDAHAEKSAADAKAKAIQAAIKKADDNDKKVLAARHDPTAAEAVSDSEEAPDPNAAPEPRSTDPALLSPDGGAPGGGGAAGRGGRGGRRGGRGGGRGKRARSESDDGAAPAEEEPSDSWGGDA